MPEQLHVWVEEQLAQKRTGQLAEGDIATQTTRDNVKAVLKPAARA
jgi:hypothetical protein